MNALLLFLLLTPITAVRDGSMPGSVSPSTRDPPVPEGSPPKPKKKKTKRRRRKDTTEKEALKSEGETCDDQETPPSLLDPAPHSVPSSSEQMSNGERTITDNDERDNTDDENCEETDTEKKALKKIVSENAPPQKIVSENAPTQKILSENAPPQKIVSENAPPQKIVSENAPPPSPSKKTSKTTKTITTIKEMRADPPLFRPLLKMGVLGQTLLSLLLLLIEFVRLAFPPIYDLVDALLVDRVNNFFLASERRQSHKPVAKEKTSGWGAGAYTTKRLVQKAADLAACKELKRINRKGWKYSLCR